MAGDQNSVNEAIREMNKGLNESQRLGAETTEGPVILIAGAGAGKTKTLIHRVATMMMRGVPPTNIMIVTFTNRAAQEIKDRLEGMVGENAQYVTAGTFHSIIFREMLQPNAHSAYLSGLGIDMSECTILDQDDSTSLLKTAIKQLPEDELQVIQDQEWSFGMFEKLMTVERSKGHGVRDFIRGMAPGDKNEVFNRIAARVWESYNALCRAANGIDFDDILVFACQMLEREPRIAEELGEKFRYLMLDEYQDTNRVQMRIMDAIAAAHKNICVVGDEKQSIYGFRGSDIKVILGFKDRYPNSKQIDMSSNYRSYGRIIDLCNACAASMGERLNDGQLLSMRGTPGPGAPKMANQGHIIAFEDDKVEAEMVARAVERDLMVGKPGKDIAILYRNREDKSELEKALWDKRVPYHVVGDTSFFKKAEVKDVIALLRLIFQPWDSAAGLRILRNVNLGVSEERAKKAMSNQGFTVNAFLEEEGERRMKTKRPGESELGLTKSAMKVSMFNNLCGEVRKAYGRGDSPADIKQMLADIWDIYLQPGVKRMASQGSGNQTQNMEARTSNVLHVLDRFEEEIEKNVPLDEMIQDFTMMVENNPDLDMNMDAKIRLMTIHASKGLEFDNVYMVAVDNHAMPGEVETEEEVEEARRVMYVGMTRAKEKLVISHSQRKFHRGKFIDCLPSPFIGEIRSIVPVPTKTIMRSDMGEDRPSESLSPA